MFMLPMLPMHESVSIQYLHCLTGRLSRTTRTLLRRDNVRMSLAVLTQTNERWSHDPWLARSAVCHVAFRCQSSWLEKEVVYPPLENGNGINRTVTVTLVLCRPVDPRGVHLLAEYMNSSKSPKSFRALNNPGSGTINWSDLSVFVEHRRVSPGAASSLRRSHGGIWVSAW